MLLNMGYINFVVLCVTNSLAEIEPSSESSLATFSAKAT